MQYALRPAEQSYGLSDDYLHASKSNQHLRGGRISRQSNCYKLCPSRNEPEQNNKMLRQIGSGEARVHMEVIIVQSTQNDIACAATNENTSQNQPVVSKKPTQALFMTYWHQIYIILHFKRRFQVRNLSWQKLNNIRVLHSKYRVII